MIEYECKKCNCDFNIDKEDVIRQELRDRYIACPLCNSRNIRIRDNIAELMQERSAVNI